MKLLRDYKSVVELPKENNLKFPIESKLEVLHAIEIFPKTLNENINQNNLIEIIFMMHLVEKFIGQIKLNL